MSALPPYTGLTYKHDFLESLVMIRPEYSVAEIGIGTGYSCFTFARKTAFVTGIDIDAELIAALEQYAAGYDNLRLIRSDVAAGIPPDECRSRMDVVFSIDTLHYIDPPHNCFAYIQKLLKPGGRAVVCFPNERDDTMEGSVNFKQLESLLAAIDAGGLQPDSIRAVRHTRWFKFITRNFWYRPKKIVFRKRYNGERSPHRFSDTIAYTMIAETGGVPWPIRAYTRLIMALLRAGGIYESFDPGEIYGRYLVLMLSAKQNAPVEAALSPAKRELT